MSWDVEQQRRSGPACTGFYHVPGRPGPENNHYFTRTIFFVLVNVPASTRYMYIPLGRREASKLTSYEPGVRF
jgi:hypothetical protein